MKSTCMGPIHAITSYMCMQEVNLHLCWLFGFNCVNKCPLAHTFGSKFELQGFSESCTWILNTELYNSYAELYNRDVLTKICRRACLKDILTARYIFGVDQPEPLYVKWLHTSCVSFLYCIEISPWDFGSNSFPFIHLLGNNFVRSQLQPTLSLPQLVNTVT